MAGFPPTNCCFRSGCCVPDAYLPCEESPVQRSKVNIGDHVGFANGRYGPLMRVPP
jgi:hypothetical protein